MASSSGSRGRRGMRPLDDPELALLPASGLIAHLYLHGTNPNAFMPVARVLEDRERRHAGAVPEEVVEGLRDEIRRAADTESRLRAELRASRRRADDAEARLREAQALLARVPAPSDSGGSSGSCTATRARHLPRRFADLDQPESSDLLARLAEAEAQIRRAQAWVRSDVEARQRRATETEAELDALNGLLWRLGLDNGRQAGEMGLHQGDTSTAQVYAASAQADSVEEDALLPEAT